MNLMKKLIFLWAFACITLALTSCSSTWTYVSDTNTSVWLKVQGRRSDMTYRMWVALPSAGVWGDAAAWGTYTATRDNDVRTGNPTTVIHFHSTSGESGNIHALDSLKQDSKFLEILSAVGSTIKGGISKAITSDMIDLYIDEATGYAQFRTSLIPMNTGLDAVRVSGRWN
jgi:hypothetical protein